MKEILFCLEYLCLLKETFLVLGHQSSKLNRQHNKANGVSLKLLVQVTYALSEFS